MSTKLSKKVLSISVSILLALSVSCPAFAASKPNLEMTSTPIHVMFVNVSNARTSLSISNHVADVYGYVQRTSNADYIHITAVLERYYNGTWYEFTKWSTSTTDYSADISTTFTVPSGTYRVATYYSVTGSSGTESNAVFSQNVSC